jgi:hypothetical protein
MAESNEVIEALQLENDDAPLRQAAAALSEPALEAIWSNPEDAVYDDL